MKTRKMLSVLGTGAVLLSLAGVAASDTVYGKFDREWLHGPADSSITEAQSIEEVNALNRSAPASNRPARITVPADTVYGGIDSEWLHGTATTSKVLENTADINQNNRAAPPASGKSENITYSDYFWVRD